MNSPCDILRKALAWKSQNAFDLYYFDVPSRPVSISYFANPSEWWKEALELGTSSRPQTFRRPAVKVWVMDNELLSISLLDIDLLAYFWCIHNQWSAHRAEDCCRPQQKMARKETDKIHVIVTFFALKLISLPTSKLVTAWLIFTSSVSVKSACHLISGKWTLFNNFFNTLKATHLVKLVAYWL